jgi:hypothetical protein
VTVCFCIELVIDYFHKDKFKNIFLSTFSSRSFESRFSDFLMLYLLLVLQPRKNVKVYGSRFN